MAITIPSFVENHRFIPYASNLKNKLDICYNVYVVSPKTLPSCYVIRLIIWEASKHESDRSKLLGKKYTTDKSNLGTEIAKSFTTLKQ